MKKTFLVIAALLFVSASTAIAAPAVKGKTGPQVRHEARLKAAGKTLKAPKKTAEVVSLKKRAEPPLDILPGDLEKIAHGG